MGEVKSKGEDLSLDLEMEDIATPIVQIEPRKTKVTKKSETIEYDQPISCLRNEVLTVRFIPRESGMVTNPKHIFYGGMGDTVTRRFTVPILESSKTFYNVLTTNEKNYLEEVMGLEPNALSVYLKKDNFWENYMVKLTKAETYLDLSDPDHYIRYKVLLANKDFIAPSLSALTDNPRATYQFVIIAAEEETKESNKGLNASMQAYMILGKIQNDKKLLKLVVEIIDGRPIANTSDIAFILGKAHKLIQADAKLFVKVAEDPYLPIKVLISDCTEFGLIKKRGDYLYLSSDNSPLCETGEDPTLQIASKFLTSSKHQEVKLSLEAKLKNLKDKE